MGYLDDLTFPRAKSGDERGFGIELEQGAPQLDAFNHFPNESNV